MRKIVITEFVSADGVAEAPEKWSLDYWNAETEKFKNDELAVTGALLLGRVTYDGFSQAWPGRTGSYADKFNNMPKYVASSSLKSVAWNGAELLHGSLSSALAKLKRTDGGDIYVHGSISLGQELLKLGLADRVSLLVYPIALGQGRKLFADGQQTKLDLRSAVRFSNGVLALDYQPMP